MTTASDFIGLLLVSQSFRVDQLLVELVRLLTHLGEDARLQVDYVCLIGLTKILESLQFPIVRTISFGET